AFFSIACPPSVVLTTVRVVVSVSVLADLTLDFRTWPESSVKKIGGTRSIAASATTLEAAQAGQTAGTASRCQGRTSSRRCDHLTARARGVPRARGPVRRVCIARKPASRTQPLE